MKRITFLLFALLGFYNTQNCVAADTSTQNLRYQAFILYNHLAIDTRVTKLWQQIVTQEVTAAKNNPQFIAAVCPQNSSCAKSGFPFSTEITGLSNLLILDASVIATCYGNSMQCIVQSDKTNMFATTIAQVRYELKQYLLT